MRNPLWFWRTVHEGDIIISDDEWWLGVVRRDFYTDRFLLAIIPLNIVIRFGYFAYMHLKFPFFWREERVFFLLVKEYERGYRDGRDATQSYKAVVPMITEEMREKND